MHYKCWRIPRLFSTGSVCSKQVKKISQTCWVEVLCSTHWQIREVSGWFSRLECRKENQELQQLVNRPTLSLGAGVHECLVARPSRPFGLQPTRLLCPWDFPGKNTGAACHILLVLEPPYRPKDWTRISCTEGRFFPAESPGKTQEETPWRFTKGQCVKGHCWPHLEDRKHQALYSPHFSTAPTTLVTCYKRGRRETQQGGDIATHVWFTLL